MLHTLFQTSLQFPQIQRFDEHFVLDILVDDGHVRGLVAMNMMEGTLVQIRANAVVMATGGAGRVYRYNTNGGIVTGDGMGMALSHGVPLRDMEFVQYHPTGLPGSGILMTEAAAVKAVFWSTKMATVICKITAWARKLRWASRKTNIWNWVTRQSFSAFCTNGVKATPSPRRVAMWFISTCVTSARKTA